MCLLKFGERRDKWKKVDEKFEVQLICEGITTILVTKFYFIRTIFKPVENVRFVHCRMVKTQRSPFQQSYLTPLYSSLYKRIKLQTSLLTMKLFSVESNFWFYNGFPLQKQLKNALRYRDNTSGKNEARVWIYKSEVRRQSGSISE